ncbi:MAG TPA: helix-turn-helix domain-containing protein [Patescibacteria group bacterium]|nr:helix-turn-helix domain-containing protein [Patescibacteria group bacterium]
MDKIVNYLKQLELSDIESKIYLKLLETGPISVRDLASAVNIKRTTAYLYIDQLIEKGLLTKVIKKSQKQIAAIAPEDTLPFLVEKKLETVRLVKKDLPTILSTIKTTLPEKHIVKDAEIKYYKGMNAVKKIYEEAFKGNEFRSYVKVEEIPVLSSDNPGLFGEAFKKNKNLKVWEIMYDSPVSRRQAFKMLSDKNNYFYKFMPPELKWSITAEDILIYDGKVVIINYSNKVSSVVLESPDFYNNSKEIFDFIWRILPEPAA